MGIAEIDGDALITLMEAASRADLEGKPLRFMYSKWICPGWDEGRLGFKYAVGQGMWSPVVWVE